MQFPKTKAHCSEVKDSFVTMMKSTGKFYRALGLTPAVFTKELIDAVRKHKEESVVTESAE